MKGNYRIYNKSVWSIKIKSRSKLNHILRRLFNSKFQKSNYFLNHKVHIQHVKFEAKWPQLLQKYEAWLCWIMEAEIT